MQVGSSSVRRNMFQYYFVLSLFVINCVGSNFTSDCGKKEKMVSYLDIAVEMINKVKSDIPPFLDIEKNITITNVTKTPVDCYDILRMGQNKSGVYTIQPLSRLRQDKLNVYCDMDTDGGGWTVIQRRGNNGNPEDYFYKDWKTYRRGFGNLEKDFWLGNNNIFALTNQKIYSVRFDLQDVEFNKSYALYDSFWIDDEFNNYTLHAEDYSGDADDSLYYHNKQNFATKDVDDDKRRHYAIEAKTGWWYCPNGCSFSSLNGLYRRGENSIEAVFWYTWSMFKSLESSEIKIRPRIS